jgi:hypothetical protein
MNDHLGYSIILTLFLQSKASYDFHAVRVNAVVTLMKVSEHSHYVAVVCLPEMHAPRRVIHLKCIAAGF